MRDIRDYFGLSNDYITQKAESSAGTTERIMSAKSTQDIMRATARRYEQAVIGPVGEFTCYLDHGKNTAEQQDAKLSDAEAEVERLKAILRRIDEQHRTDIRVIKEEYQEQIVFLRDQLKAWQSMHSQNRKTDRD